MTRTIRSKELLVFALVIVFCGLSGCRCRKPLPPPIEPISPDQVAIEDEQRDETPKPPPTEDVSETKTEIEDLPRMDTQVEEVQIPELKMVHFDYDKYEIRESDIQLMKTNAAWLLEHMGDFDAVKVEGHCDERGTNKYNMVLGERRANAVREFLINEGIPGSLIVPVSYGEERPVDLGHDENAWAMNRRAEFRIVMAK